MSLAGSGGDAIFSLALYVESIIEHDLELIELLKRHCRFEGVITRKSDKKSDLH